MSRPSRSGSKLTPMERRIPRNPKYDGVKSRLDTGASQSKSDERRRFFNSHYKKKKGEVFKRITIQTFAQLVINVADEEEDRLDEAGESALRGYVTAVFSLAPIPVACAISGRQAYALARPGLHARAQQPTRLRVPRLCRRR